MLWLFFQLPEVAEDYPQKHCTVQGVVDFFCNESEIMLIGFTVNRGEHIIICITFIYSCSACLLFAIVINVQNS